MPVVAGITIIFVLLILIRINPLWGALAALGMFLVGGIWLLVTHYQIILVAV